jgi:hypothetical protein
VVFTVGQHRPANVDDSSGPENMDEA